ncbi:MAG: glycosyl transferase [Lachnospiraceae bacterium]|nr:glycosyl transferase [Lachnospiraceae bacterium]
MIGTELLQGQGLGNALFCYITTRCIALKQGCDFGILGREVLEGISGKNNGLYFMDLDFGLPAIKEDFNTIYQEKEDRLFLGNSRHDCRIGCYVTGADKGLPEAEDGSLLYGNMQAEEYFLPYRKEIKEWLKIKPEYDSHEFTRDNLCIINIRGGEYTGSPELFVNRKYWLKGMRYMRSLRPDMEFMVVTDDVASARRILPEVEAFHFTLDKDYVTIKNARYLLLSNSSFAFFPAFTSETVQEIVAPKFWARHNVSDGYWASEQNIYTGWRYMDRTGRLFTAEECRKELAEYKEKSPRYKKLNQKPAGLALKLMQTESELYYGLSWIKRVFASLRRRICTARKNG